VSFAAMLSSGPMIRSEPVKVHTYPAKVMRDWQDIYAAMGVTEKTAVMIAEKLARTRKAGLPEISVKSLHRRLRKMEELGFVSQRKVTLDPKVRPVMIWARLNKPCQ